MFVPDNPAKPPDIDDLAQRCSPAITFATRGDLYLPRKSPFESVAAANNIALTLPRAYLGRKVSLDRR
jgi:hypothetical protein